VEPVVLIVAHVLAVGADREEVAQQTHLGERRLEILHELLALLFGLLAHGDVAPDSASC
jgi:hypothetical protein